MKLIFLLNIPLLGSAINSDGALPTNHLCARMLQRHDHNHLQEAKEAAGVLEEQPSAQQQLHLPLVLSPQGHVSL
jgi:hypothetical protein